MNGGPTKFLEELNKSFGSGVLTCDLDPQEFRNFLKWLMKNYFRCLKLYFCILTANYELCIKILMMTR